MSPGDIISNNLGSASKMALVTPKSHPHHLYFMKTAKFKYQQH
ncbi:hypothetical protein A2U01_0095516, partial [Trifolium medium]|nr:hypothetical protein [Trifolium medium]